MGIFSIETLSNKDEGTSVYDPGGILQKMAVHGGPSLGLLRGGFCSVRSMLGASDFWKRPGSGGTEGSAKTFKANSGTPSVGAAQWWSADYGTALQMECCDATRTATSPERALNLPLLGSYTTQL